MQQAKLILIILAAVIGFSGCAAPGGGNHSQTQAQAQRSLNQATEQSNAAATSAAVMTPAGGY